MKSLYIFRHSRNLIVWRLQAALFKSLNHLELDSTPPTLDSSLFIEFLDGAASDSSTTKNFTRMKIGYALLIWERFEYLPDSIESMLNSNLSDVDIVFFLIDDGSADLRVQKYLLSLKSKYPNLDIRIHLEEHLNGTAGSVINRAVRIMTNSDRFEILGWGDPDCIYNRDWLGISLNLFQSARMIPHQKIRIFTSYNSASTMHLHQVVKQIETPFGDILLRRQFGMANVLVLLDDLRKIGLFHETPDDESIFIKRLASLDYIGACPMEGLIEHIGENSALNGNRPRSLPRADFSMLLRKGGWPTQILKYSNYSIENYIKELKVTPLYSEEAIDVAIVSHPKDFSSLPKVVESLRTFLKHPLGDIFLISEDSIESRRIATNLQLQFLDEETVFPHIYQYDLRPVGRINRTGWLRQQFIKLSLDQIGNCEQILAIDSDTVLLRDQALISEKKALIQFSEEYHQPYFQTYFRILGSLPSTKISFVSHKMLFNKSRLMEMKDEIERKHGIAWHRAVYLNTELTDMSGFSEFELYGHWMLKNHPNDVFTNFWSNIALDLDKLRHVNQLSKDYGKEFENASFHNYKIS